MPKRSKNKLIYNLKRRKRHLVLHHMKESVTLANSETDLMKKVCNLNFYQSICSGQTFKISCKEYHKCTQEIFSWMLDLLEENMAELYKNCDWGWDIESKKKEMSEESSRFLIAYSEKDSNPVAFSHFRFDMDNGVNVVYCYELQIDKAARKQGLGKHMMDILQSLSQCYNMRKVILTVFNFNKSAMGFFSSQGFTLDETSPQNFSVETFYSILSRVNHL